MRMPREASAMTIYRYAVLVLRSNKSNPWGGQMQPVVDSRGLGVVQVATRFKWAFLGAVEKGVIGEDKSLFSGPLGLVTRKIQSSSRSAGLETS